VCAWSSRILGPRPHVPARDTPDIANPSKTSTNYIKVSICIYVTVDEAWSVTPGAQVALREVAQLEDVRLSSVSH
jgi:hypothetical protein